MEAGLDGPPTMVVTVRLDILLLSWKVTLRGMFRRSTPTCGTPFDHNFRSQLLQLSLHPTSGGNLAYLTFEFLFRAMRLLTLTPQYCLIRMALMILHAACTFRTVLHILHPQHHESSHKLPDRVILTSSHLPQPSRIHFTSLVGELSSVARPTCVFFVRCLSS